MHISSLIAAAAAWGTSLVQASTFAPTRPPSVPLAVRSPYLNTWLQNGANGVLPGTWPTFWTDQIQGWQGFVAVDGTVYNWMGAAPGPATVTQTSLEYTSTRSIFTFDVNGAVTLTATFLSPIFPNDMSRQSQQFSYIAIEAQSADGASHDVQVYMDVSGEWSSGDLTQIINWGTGSSDGVSYHNFYLQSQAEFTESDQIADWGNWYLSTASGNDLTWQIGQDIVVRGQFENYQNLTNTLDTNFRAIQDDWPVFAFVHDLGSVGRSSKQVLYSLGLVQDNVVTFAGANQTLTPQPGLWSSYYSSDLAAMTAFFNDYGYASSAANSLDAQIQGDSVKAAGQDYATITTLAARQAFGGLQFAGTHSDPLIFLKEISSDGDTNTVDVIFPAYPILMYLNPTLGKYLLDPLYINQESGAYPNAWAEHDLGLFPVASGYPQGNDEAMPLEECGNMIIMTLAYAQRTGDNGYLSDHYPKLEQWAQYLINDSLIPANQLSTDDFAGTLANQTNLAIKGIIGLKAMSQIAERTKNTDTYGAIAESYLQQWKGFAINNASSPPHTTLNYGNESSWSTLYNLFGDKLLGLNFVDQWIYDMQSNFYPTVADTYGVPLDTRHTWAKGDWQMLTAAVSSESTRALFISDLASWVGNTTTERAMTDLFDAVTGGFPVNGPTFVARPVLGGTFALLALEH